MNALLYLWICQWRGAVRNILRSGFRAFMGILALAYVASALIQGAYFSRKAASLQFPANAIPPSYLSGMLLFLLFVPAVGAAYQGFRGKAVAFSAADIDFLFSMPIPQRLTLAFRMAADSLQIFGVLLLAAIWTWPILTQLLQTTPGILLPRSFAAIFLCFLFLQTASHAAYLFYAHRVKASEFLDWAFKIVGGALLAGLVVAIAWDASRGSAPIDQIRIVFTHPVVRALLLPLTLTTDVILSANWRFPDVAGRNLLILAGMAAIGIVAVFGQRTNVYEPSLFISLRRFRLRGALRSGGVASVRAEMMRERGETPLRGFAAPVLGTGWRALIWKSLQMWLHSPWLSFGICAFCAAGIPFLLDRNLSAENRMGVAFVTPIGWAYFTFIIGMSQLPRTRAELVQGDALKSLPLPAWKIVGAMIFPTVAGFALTLWAYSLFSHHFFSDVPQPTLLPFAILLPVLVANLSLYHVWVALLYPRRKDPLHKLLSGMLLLPGWGLLLLLPFGSMSAAMGAIYYQHHMGAVEDPFPVAARTLLEMSAGFVALYLLTFAALLWIAGMAFQAYSPAED